MRYFICASHGRFAEGIIDSLRMIIGKRENVSAMGAYINGKDTLSEEVNKISSSLSPTDELVVITDILGGSVNNEWMKCLKDYKNIHVVAGLNLPFLIDLLLMDNQQLDTTLLIKNSIKNVQDSLVYCNYLGEALLKDRDDF